MGAESPGCPTKSPTHLTTAMIPTPEQIRELPAGAELDRLIAENVMGLSNVRQGWIEYAHGDLIVWEENHENHPKLRPALLHDEDSIVPGYSINIAAAFQVFNKFEWHLERGIYDGNVYYAVLDSESFVRDIAGGGIASAIACEDTAPVAICKAAALVTLHP